MGSVRAQESITLATAGADTLPADLYGQGPRAVVLIAHGGYSTKASWATEARTIAEAGFRGGGRGQRLFATVEGPRVMREILSFLAAP